MKEVQWGGKLERWTRVGDEGGSERAGRGLRRREVVGGRERGSECSGCLMGRTETKGDPDR